MHCYDYECCLLFRAESSGGSNRIDSGPSASASSASSTTASSKVSNDISSETAGPIETELNVKPPWAAEQKLLARSWSHDQDCHHAHGKNL